ncbi:hypothetical protein CFB47_06765 [Burkholderia sp. AU27893]|nr:hypothetical protein CFB47_39780 [Burkholderia sp. AU27893]OXI62950.1 hypothetical protein CFB47_06765 [Burkholderia sp. AU27893]
MVLLRPAAKVGAEHQLPAAVQRLRPGPALAPKERVQERARLAVLPRLAQVASTGCPRNTA